MPIPDFQSLMLPILRIANRGEAKASQAINELSDQLKLTESERSERQASGVQTVIFNRAHWAITYLAKSGLIERPRRGWFVITDRGRQVLSQPPDRITIPFLKQFPDFQAPSPRPKKEKAAIEEILAPDATSGTPDEQIDAALKDFDESLQAELLDRISHMGHTAFEKLILDLVVGMGYGVGGSAMHVGQTSDGGVDGIISEDVLGLDVIYLQAKHYKEGNAVSVDKLREFVGTLAGRGATKGVFVTLSHFTESARNFVEKGRITQTIKLIDGGELTKLLIKHGVGVRISRKIEIKKIDSDYFENVEE